MKSDSEIKALISLLDDESEMVWQKAYEELSLLNPQQYFQLNEIIENQSITELVNERIEQIQFNIRFNYFEIEFEKWTNNPKRKLEEGLVLITQIEYPNYSIEALNQQLEQLRVEAWLEFHYDLTSFEKVKILNYILFNLHGFTDNETNFLNPENSFINQVLETKKGNPISLSLIYLILAQKLKMPVYGVNLPKHFICCYLKEDNPTEQNFKDKEMLAEIPHNNEVFFYINPYNKGGVFNFDELLKTIKNMGLEYQKSYSMPCNYYDICLRILKNLFNSYMFLNIDFKSFRYEKLIKKLEK